MEAVIQISRAIEVGDVQFGVAESVESTGRAPWIMLKPTDVLPRSGANLFSSTLGWRMVNPAMSSEWTVSLGEGAELLAGKYKIPGTDQDNFALASQQKAAPAWESGFFEDEIVQVSSHVLERDESL